MSFLSSDRAAGGVDGGDSSVTTVCDKQRLPRFTHLSCLVPYTPITVFEEVHKTWQPRFEWERIGRVTPHGQQHLEGLQLASNTSSSQYVLHHGLPAGSDACLFLSFRGRKKTRVCPIRCITLVSQKRDTYSGGFVNLILRIIEFLDERGKELRNGQTEVTL